MKARLRQILGLVCCIAASFQMYAQTVAEIDGLFYKLYGDGVAAVTTRTDGQPYIQESIVVPDSVEFNSKFYKVVDFQWNAFCDLPNLRSLKLSNYIEDLPMNAFEGSPLEEIVFPENRLHMYMSAVGRCSTLDTIVFNTKSLCIERDVSYVLAKKIVFMGDVDIDPIATSSSGAHDNEIVTPAGEDSRANRIQPQTNKDLVVDWGDGVLGISDLYWYHCETLKLTGKTFLICNQWTSVGAYYVKKLELAELVPLPDNYIDIRISATALKSCSALETIICHGSKPWPIADLIFEDPDQMDRITVYVPAEAVDTYKADPHWGKFSRILPITDGVTDITADGADMDAEAPVEYFNMQGQRIDSPQSGTVAIRRQGSKATKIVVK